MRLEMYQGGTKYRTPLIRIPFTLEAHSEDEEDKAQGPSAAASSPAMDTDGLLLRPVNGDVSPHCSRLLVTTMSIVQSQSRASEKELALLQEVGSEKENDTVDMVDPTEIADENPWIKEPVGTSSSPVTDFVSGIAFSIEHSQMCMSPLAESSAIPCENSNIQVRHFSMPESFAWSLVLLILER